MGGNLELTECGLVAESGLFLIGLTWVNVHFRFEPAMMKPQGLQADF